MIIASFARGLCGWALSRIVKDGTKSIFAYLIIIVNLFGALSKLISSSFTLDANGIGYVISVLFNFFLFFLVNVIKEKE